MPEIIRIEGDSKSLVDELERADAARAQLQEGFAKYNAMVAKTKAETSGLNAEERNLQAIVRANTDETARRVDVAQRLGVTQKQLNLAMAEQARMELNQIQQSAEYIAMQRIAAMEKEKQVRAIIAATVATEAETLSFAQQKLMLRELVGTVEAASGAHSGLRGIIRMALNPEILLLMVTVAAAGKAISVMTHGVEELHKATREYDQRIIDHAGNLEKLATKHHHLSASQALVVAEAKKIKQERIDEEWDKQQKAIANASMAQAGWNFVAVVGTGLHDLLKKALLFSSDAAYNFAVTLGINTKAMDENHKKTVAFVDSLLTLGGVTDYAKEQIATLEAEMKKYQQRIALAGNDDPVGVKKHGRDWVAEYKRFIEELHVAEASGTDKIRAEYQKRHDKLVELHKHGAMSAKQFAQDEVDLAKWKRDQIDAINDKSVKSGLAEIQQMLGHELTGAEKIRATYQANFNKLEELKKKEPLLTGAVNRAELELAKKLGEDLKKEGEKEAKDKEAARQKDLKQQQAFLNRFHLNHKRTVDQNLKESLAEIAAEIEARKAEGKTFADLEQLQVEVHRQAELAKRAETAETVAGALNSMSGFFGKSKAFSYAQAIISTYEAATKAFAQAGGYPAGVMPMLMSIMTGLGHVATIAGTNAGAAHRGQDRTGDSTIRVIADEMVLDPLAGRMGRELVEAARKGVHGAGGGAITFVFPGGVRTRKQMARDAAKALAVARRYRAG